MQASDGERSLSSGRESQKKASAVVSKKKERKRERKKIEEGVLDQREVGGREIRIQADGGKRDTDDGKISRIKERLKDEGQKQEC